MTPRPTIEQIWRQLPHDLEHVAERWERLLTVMNEAYADLDPGIDGPIESADARAIVAAILVLAAEAVAAQEVDV